MLNAGLKSRHLGFSLVELMVGISIMAILVAVAMPNFQSWLKNIQIRNAAESITNGLQRARAAAVSRNVNVTFNLLADTSWTVTPAGGTPIDSRQATEGSTNVTCNATTITYNNLGQGSASLVDVTAAGGSPLRVEINAGGGARMCDCSLAVGSNPRACLAAC